MPTSTAGEAQPRRLPHSDGERQLIGRRGMSAGAPDSLAVD